jgi:hypothetical protein
MSLEYSFFLVPGIVIHISESDRPSNSPSGLCSPLFPFLEIFQLIYILKLGNFIAHNFSHNDNKIINSRNASTVIDYQLF